MESPGHIYGYYFHVNNDNLGLTFDPGKRSNTFTMKPVMEEKERKSNGSGAVLNVYAFNLFFLYKGKKYFVYVPYQQGSNQLNEATK